MNLILSGPIDNRLAESVMAITAPAHVKTINFQALLLDNVNDSVDLRQTVASICNPAKVDYAYIAPGKSWRDFRLLAIDMDSTLITIECIDEIADFAGVKDEVARITEATMRGEVKDFTESLIARVSLLAGLDVEVLNRVYNERLTLSPGAAALISNARECKFYCLLVSGGFTFFTDRLCSLLGFDASYSNQLEVVENRLTGRLRGPIVDGKYKAQLVARAMKSLQISPNQAIVIGDGANDIAMMSEVTTSVAYHAKPAVREAASLEINFGGLDTLLNYLY